MRVDPRGDCAAPSRRLLLQSDTDMWQCSIDCGMSPRSGTPFSGESLQERSDRRAFTVADLQRSLDLSCNGNSLMGRFVSACRDASEIGKKARSTQA
jgi:hypothetical protein